MSCTEAGGSFSEADGQPAQNLATWDGTAWHPILPGVNGAVFALAADANDALFVGGAFTAAGDLSLNQIGRAVLSRSVSTEASGAEAALALDGPYPNPATGSTTLKLTLTGAETLRLAVYDLLGREVLRLPDAPRVAGTHTLALPLDGLAPGTYVIRVHAGASEVHTRRFTVLSQG